MKRAEPYYRSHPHQTASSPPPPPSPAVSQLHYTEPTIYAPITSHQPPPLESPVQPSSHPPSRSHSLCALQVRISQHDTSQLTGSSVSVASGAGAHQETDAMRRREVRPYPI